MKTTFTIHRSTLALIVPRPFKSIVLAIFEKADRLHNGYITITIENKKKPRTTGPNSQNHHLNGHIQQICKETGDDFEYVKHEVKYKAIKMGYPILEIGGVVQLDVQGRPKGISEADASTEECGLLIDAAHEVAAFVGIVNLKETE